MGKFIRLILILGIGFGFTQLATAAKQNQNVKSAKLEKKSKMKSHKTQKLTHRNKKMSEKERKALAKKQVERAKKIAAEQKRKESRKIAAVQPSYSEKIVLSDSGMSHKVSGREKKVDWILNSPSTTDLATDDVANEESESSDFQTNRNIASESGAIRENDFSRSTEVIEREADNSDEEIINIDVDQEDEGETIDANEAFDP